jgi:hypothetical protein
MEKKGNKGRIKTKKGETIYRQARPLPVVPGLN